MSINNEPLFTSGTYRVHTQQTGTSNLDNNFDRRTRVAISNSPENLRTLFFGPEVRKLLLISEQVSTPVQALPNLPKSDQHLASLIAPTSPYTEAALMAVVTSSDQLVKETHRVDLVYDYPDYVQDAYWRMVSQVFENAMNQRSQDVGPFRDRDIIPIMMGHHARTVGFYPPQPDRPSTRTLKLHHDHIMFVNKKAIEPEEWDDSRFRLPQEARIFLKDEHPNLIGFSERLNDKPKVKGVGVKFVPRDSKPLGYEAHVEFSGRTISEVLNAHFIGYKELISEMEVEHATKLKYPFRPANLVLQPSFTIFIIPYNSKDARLIISPNLVPIGGPERAGLQLIRRPDIPARMSSEEIDRLQRQVLV